MNDPVLADLLAALNVLVLEPLEPAGAAPAAFWAAPAWAEAFLPASSASPAAGADRLALRPGNLFPFLECFLPDAEWHWATTSDASDAGGTASAPDPRRLRSDVWTEVDPAGRRIPPQSDRPAQGGRPLLVITRAEDEYAELHSALQGGRDNLLRHGLEMRRADRDVQRLTAERERRPDRQRQQEPVPRADGPRIATRR